MKKVYLSIVIILISGFSLFAQFENLHFGSDSTLDVVSWNIEHFPKNGQTTINYVTQIIEALDADIIAIQEISDESYLNELIENLDGWDGYYAYSQYVALGYLYKTSVIEDPDIFEIYTSKSREFPRSPLVLEVDYQYEHIVVINNHLKCCGDGSLDINDEWDEETRRYDACNLLDEYISDSHPNDKVFVVGDMNDELTNSYSNNVFRVFIDDPEKYDFVDMGIAEGSSTNWSYPTWPSHLDHILITDELFDEYENPGSGVECIRLDDYFSSWSAYDNNVSDHRPVGVKIKTNSSLGVDDKQNQLVSLLNYPNPASGLTTISISAQNRIASIQICDVSGKPIRHFSLSNNQTSVNWNTSLVPSGIYFVKLIVDNRVLLVNKLVVL